MGIIKAMGFGFAVMFLWAVIGFCILGYATYKKNDLPASVAFWLVGPIGWAWYALASQIHDYKDDYDGHND